MALVSNATSYTSPSGARRADGDGREREPGAPL